MFMMKLEIAKLEEKKEEPWDLKKEVSWPQVTC